MLGTALALASLALAGLFVVSGLSKLRDRTGTRRAVGEFGCPDLLTGPVALVLPFAELATGVALVPNASARWGAVAAMVLLVVFTAAIVFSLARGRRPDCHCFGRLRSAPASPAAVVRNIAFAAIAGFVVWQGGDLRSDPVLWTHELNGANLAMVIVAIVCLVLFVFGGWFMFQLLKQHGRLLARVDSLEDALREQGIVVGASQQLLPALASAGLSVGAPAPMFDLLNLAGERVSLMTLLAAKHPVLLTFTGPGCAACTSLLPEIARWRQDFADQLTVVLVSEGNAEDNAAYGDRHQASRILLQEDREVGVSYQVYGHPSAVLVRPDGTIGSRVVAGAEEIRRLLLSNVAPHAGSEAFYMPGNGNGADSSPPQALRLGDPAPLLQLVKLGGDRVALADFSVAETLVLFWDPFCGFCQKMIPGLQAWEATPPLRAPQLLIVSTGSVQANRDMGLESPVLVDPSSEAMRTFSAHGTPTGILVDVSGRIASELAVGGAAVMSLARRGQPRTVAVAGG